MDGWMPGTGMPSYGMDDYMTGMAMHDYDMGYGGYGDYTAQRQPGFPGGGFPGGPGGPGGTWISRRADSQAKADLDFREAGSQAKDQGSQVEVSLDRADLDFREADSLGKVAKGTASTNIRAAKLHTVLSGRKWWSTALRSRPGRN